MDTVEDRVARGLAWIKANDGHRFDLTRVDVESINVRSDEHCVLAQASGRTFSDVWEDLLAAGIGNRWGVDHGFDWSMAEHGHDDADRLNDEWRRVLTAAQVT